MAERQRTRDQGTPTEGVDASSFAAPRRAPRRAASEALHICPRCQSGLVYPTDWAPRAQKRWAVSLRCPDCEWDGSGVYTQDAVDRLDEALDAGTGELLEDLNLLARANFEEQVNGFVEALWADQVLPEDF